MQRSAQHDMTMLRKMTSTSLLPLLSLLSLPLFASAIPIIPRDGTANTTATDKVYDYIVIGSGAAGIPLAATLSASGASTLLIERGPPSSGRWGGTQRPSWLANTNLTFYDVPALDNEIYVDGFGSGIFCPDVSVALAGCVLGGGTAVNAGLWWAPASADWDSNFAAAGIEGWGSADLVSATQSVFAKIPGTTVPSMDGELYLQQGANVLEGALSQAGWTREVSNETPDGKVKGKVYANTTFMYENGERGGPMATYLVEAAARPNFEIWVESQVIRVVRNGSVATGVEVQSTGNLGNSGTVSLSGKGGVILSAGSFGTPKILFRSGIGPQDMLEVVQAAEGDAMVVEDEWINLPVGYNLVDNINVSGQEINSNVSYADTKQTDMVIKHPNVTFYQFTAAYNNPIPSDSAAYLDDRTGILTQSASNLNPMVWEPVTGTDGDYRQLQWTARVDSSLGIANTDGEAMTLSNYLGLGQVARGRATIDNNLNMLVQTMPSVGMNAADRAAIVQGLDDMRAVLGNITDLTILAPVR